MLLNYSHPSSSHLLDFHESCSHHRSGLWNLQIDLQRVVKGGKAERGELEVDRGGELVKDFELPISPKARSVSSSGLESSP